MSVKAQMLASIDSMSPQQARSMLAIAEAIESGENTKVKLLTAIATLSDNDVRFLLSVAESIN